MNINDKSDCRRLIDRILRTLSGAGYDISKIQEEPSEFYEDDRYIFGGLCRAIFTIRAVYSSVEKHLTKLEEYLLHYDINEVASLPDEYVKEEVYKKKIK